MDEVRRQIEETVFRLKTLRVVRTVGQWTDEILSLPAIQQMARDAEKWNMFKDILHIPLGDLLVMEKDAKKWHALSKKYPNFCKRFDPEIDRDALTEGKEET